jgi:hypothetical protein
MRSVVKAGDFHHSVFTSVTISPGLATLKEAEPEGSYLFSHPCSWINDDPGTDYRLVK